MRAETERRNRNHLVSDLDPVHAFADSRDAAGAFNPQRNGPVPQSGIEPQGFEHIAEVERGGGHGNLDFADRRRTSFDGAQGETIQRAGVADLDAEGLPGGDTPLSTRSFAAQHSIEHVLRQTV